MKKVKNVIGKIEETREILNTNYDMSLKNMREIISCSKNEFEISSNSFVFGYLQGMKAEKKRQSEANKALQGIESRFNAS